MKTATSARNEYSIARRRHGFTMIELMVVIAIAAILAALVMGGFFQIAASNRRSNCQVNLSQIYTALRMYAQDEPSNKFPDFESIPADNRSMGLWKLYTVQKDPADPTVPIVDDPATPFPDGFSQFPSAMLYAADPTKRLRKITGMYLRSHKNLHCPSDEADNLVDDDGVAATPPILVSNAQLYTNSTNERYNQNYLSYQGFDVGGPNFSDNAAYFPRPLPPNPQDPSGVSTYLPRRTPLINDPVGGPPNPDWKRQLIPYVLKDSAVADIPSNRTDVVEKQPAANTVITWCRHHRTGLGARDNDIVLFYDGSIQTIAQQQSNSLPPGTPLMTWRRKAKTADFG